MRASNVSRLCFVILLLAFRPNIYLIIYSSKTPSHVARLWSSLLLIAHLSFHHSSAKDYPPSKADSRGPNTDVLGTASRTSSAGVHAPVGPFGRPQLPREPVAEQQRCRTAL
jgi:hypothetical protein